MMPPALAYQEVGWSTGITLTPPIRKRVRESAPVAFSKPPEWVAAAATRLVELVSINHGWDGYAGRPVTIQAAQFAMAVLSEVMRHDVPLPSIVPLSYGGIQLEWHRKGWDLELEIESAGRLTAYVRDLRNNVESVTDFGADLSALSGLVSNVAG
jgi:hypothetical protein